MLDGLSASLAENLRRLRELRGFTQQELSDVSGVPRPTLAHLESGSANPTLSVLVRVAAALSVPMEDLIASGALLEFHAKKSLFVERIAGAQRIEVCPGAPSGFVVERIEIDVRGRFQRELGRGADRTYLSCERGELDVACGSERCELRAGDVAVVRRGAAHEIQNRGRGSALLYSVRWGGSSG